MAPASPDPSAQVTAPPRVSVVIPTHNRGRMLVEALESVLRQAYPPQRMEVVVVDDGSTDDTPARLAAYAGRVTVLRQSNRGVSAARNRGVAASRGGLIAFLDSDDLWLPGKLRTQAAFFQRHPDALICQTEEIWVRGGRRVNPRRRHRKPSGMIFEASLELCLVSPSAVMLRRRLLEEVGGFDESLPACEDYDLWLRIGRRHPVHLLDEALVVKRGGHADQLSRMPALDRYRVRAICNLFEAGVLNASQRAAALRVLRVKCTVLADGCAKRGRGALAQRYRRLPERYESKRHPP